MINQNALRAAVIAMFMLAGLKSTLAGNLTLAIGGPVPQSDVAGLLRVVQNVVGKLSPGDTLTVVDGVSRQLIGSLTYRADDSEWSTRALRERQFENLSSALRRHIIQGALSSASRPWTLDIPSTALAIAELGPAPGQPTTLIFIGRIRHHTISSDPAEQSWDMEEKRLPNDSAILGLRTQNPYGTRGKEQALRGTKLNVCWIEGDNDFPTTAYREGVERFWRLYAKNLGATVGVVAPFRSGCLDQAIAGVVSPSNPELKPSGSPAMVVVDSGAAVQSPQPTPPAPIPAVAVPQPVAPVVEWTKTLPQCPMAPPRGHRARIIIGARWADDADFDLYARMPGGNWLYFRNKSEPEGFLKEDIQSATGDTWEHISLTKEVDIDNIEIAVNLFKGNLQSPGKTFEVRIWVTGNECVYIKKYTMPARVGNQGAGGPLSGQPIAKPNERWGQHWVRIPVRDLLEASSASDQSGRR